MKSTFFRRQYPLGMGMSSLKDEIFYTQKNIIRDFAAKGSCIIVGRCADYILEDIPGWQSVFDHKDLMIDSSRFGIDGTAKILADIVRNQWG